MGSTSHFLQKSKIGHYNTATFLELLFKSPYHNSSNRARHDLELNNKGTESFGSWYRVVKSTITPLNWSRSQQSLEQKRSCLPSRRYVAGSPDCQITDYS